MGYIYGPKKNESFQFTVRLLAVADGEFAVNPTFVAGDWKVSINGGTLNALATTPTISPAGSSQIVVNLAVGENPGPFTTVQFIDLTDPKAYHDNAWEVHSTNVGAGSGAVITVNPSAFIDAEAIANLVGPYVANLLINSLNLPTAGEWAQILAQNALITAIKSKTDLMDFVGSLLKVRTDSFATAAQTDLRTQVHASLIDSANTIAELTSMPLGSASFGQMLSFLYMKERNGGMQNNTIRQINASDDSPKFAQNIDNDGTAITFHPFDDV
jgi:hypothetical protein